MTNLTSNAIARIRSGDFSGFQPIVQIYNIKNLTSGTQQRFRFVVTDGVETISAMPASQISPLITSGELRENTIVRLLQFQPNMVNDQQ